MIEKCKKICIYQKKAVTLQRENVRKVYNVVMLKGQKGV